MIHLVDWNAPAKLVKGESVSQFGDGYRQVSGPVVEEGTVMSLLESARKLDDSRRHPLFIANEGGRNPFTIAEVEQQLQNWSGQSNG